MVTAAGVLLAAMAAAGLAYAVTGLVVSGGTVARFRRAAEAAGVAPDDISGLAALARTGPIVAAVLGVLVAALLVVLAVGVLRGGNGWRIATWVVCGLGLLCGAGTLALSVAQRVGDWAGGTDDPVALRALAGATPGWWLWLNGTLSVVQGLGYVVVAALLASPAASRHFRRAAPSPAAATPSPYPPNPSP
jgi:hypothetical protein